MKKKQISLDKKLFLDKHRIAELNTDQQLVLEGGAVAPNEKAGGMSFSMTCFATICIHSKVAGTCRTSNCTIF
ncbi:class I lanthipeptide [Chitinophaga nivalis]|uniref:Class I lanthipeptide n=1 Tax=Chitinophaga nivalis TaxID=2991709 RepID=A0ABT3ILV3_9BACT|nr:class I lanthipeptide [Chitinophaga nivalis]MCW3465559.1 class I lanthipeptide [Chitinophaga nivalis]MCW3484750.1 class I lanthipeptide [Chitinophaga nivalis]